MKKEFLKNHKKFCSILQELWKCFFSASAVHFIFILLSSSLHQFLFYCVYMKGKGKREKKPVSGVIAEKTHFYRISVTMTLFWLFGGFPALRKTLSRHSLKRCLVYGLTHFRIYIQLSRWRKKVKNLKSRIRKKIYGSVRVRERKYFCTRHSHDFNTE